MEDNVLKICKVRRVKTPTRGTSLSAGLDFYIPEDFPGTVHLPPQLSINIPSGIKVKIPHGYCLWFRNKSGVAVKKDLRVGAEIVDEDYQGEVHIHLTNVGMEIQELRPGEKIVQALLVPVMYAGVEEVESELELYGGEETQRGEGGFGSTGNE